MSAAHWGPDADCQVDVQSNAEYLAWVTETIADRKRQLIAALKLLPGQIALDAGCGIGDDVVAMAQYVGPTGRVVGFDHADAMLNEARKKTADLELPIEFVKGDIYEMPFKDESFDVVRSDRVFQHLDEPQRAVHELTRILKPGGLISLNDQDGDAGIFDYPDRDLYRRVRHAISDHYQTNAFAGRSFYRHLKAAGMDVELIDAYCVPVLTLELADAFVNATRWGSACL